MITFKRYLTEYAGRTSVAPDNDGPTISPGQIQDLERFADGLLKQFGVDVEFTKHFGERMTDSRNKPLIKVAELQALFKKVSRDHADKIKKFKNREAVLKDLQTNLNLPFIVKPTKDGELDVVLKTIMRKKDFKTPDPTVTY